MKKVFILTTALILTAAACNKQVSVNNALNQTTSNQQADNKNTDSNTWKTYTNDTYHFSLDLPNNSYDPTCKVSKPVTANENGNVIKIGAEFNCADRDPNMPFQGWTIYAAKNIGNQIAAQAFLDKTFGKGCTIEEWSNNRFFIGSLNQTNDNPFGDCKMPGIAAKIRTFYSPTNSTIVFWSMWQEFQFHNQDGSTNDDKMLETFKFTDATSTANWKTYTNTKYGFSFKYPGEMVVVQEGSSRLGTAGIVYSVKFPDSKWSYSVDVKANTTKEKLAQAFDENYNYMKQLATPDNLEFQLKDYYTSDIKVAGLDAKELYIDHFSDVGSTMASVVTNKNVYLIAGGENKGDLDLFLSTFKFTN